MGGDTQKHPPKKKCVRELLTSEQVQLSLSGVEVYSLVVAFQMWKATSCSGKLGTTKSVAEMTARKLHKALVACPHTYTLLDQGWNLERTDSETQTGDKM